MLSGAVGLESSSITQWLTWPSRFWSIGPQLAETLLDFGKRRGQLLETEAAYDATVATYRQTVLTAFQQVEDNLAALRILEQESTAEDRAVNDARHSLDVTTEQYKSGVTDYLQVLTAQTTVLNNEASAISIRVRRMTASVLLIEALGGGWDASQLPGYTALISAK
jgi:outer membrane protein TolC